MTWGPDENITTTIEQDQAIQRALEEAGVPLQPSPVQASLTELVRFTTGMAQEVGAGIAISTGIDTTNHADLAKAVDEFLRVSRDFFSEPALSLQLVCGALGEAESSVVNEDDWQQAVEGPYSEFLPESWSGCYWAEDLVAPNEVYFEALEDNFELGQDLDEISGVGLVYEEDHEAMEGEDLQMVCENFESMDLEDEEMDLGN